MTCFALLYLLNTIERLYHFTSFANMMFYMLNFEICIFSCLVLHNRIVFILIHLSKFADALKISVLSIIKDLRTKHYYLGYWLAQRLTTTLGYHVTSRDSRFSYLRRHECTLRLIIDIIHWINICKLYNRIRNVVSLLYRRHIKHISSHCLISW